MQQMKKKPKKLVLFKNEMNNILLLTELVH